MSQYKIGTVSVTNGSATVTGLGTSFLANVTAGDLFIRSGDGVYYFVANVASDTSLTLTAPYGGVTGSGASYVLHRDFITILGVSVPLMQDGDLETVVVYNRMLQALFEAYGATPNGTAATADLTTSATDTTAGRVTKVGDYGQGVQRRGVFNIVNYHTITPISLLSTIGGAGFYEISDGTGGPLASNGAPQTFGVVKGYLNTSNSYQYSWQEFTGVAGNRKWMRRALSDSTWTDWEEIWHSGNLNTLEFGGIATDCVVAVGYAASATIGIFYLPLNLFSDVSSITVISTFSVRTANSGTATGGAAVTPTIDVTLSGSRMLAIRVSVLSGLTVGEVLHLRQGTATSKITVTP